MLNNETISKLLTKLLEDSQQDRINAFPIQDLPTADTEKKRLIRSLMNIRMPRKFSNDLIKLQDNYLQEELAEKGIVTLSDIPTIKEQYDSPDIHADKISLWQGDITQLATGAIVNAANSQMLGCFVPCHRCIDNAIHSAAGMQLRDECSCIMAKRRLRYGKNYEEPTGTATLTKAYNLPCDYVIHTVGPIVYGNLNDTLRQDLRNCYDNVLKCCAENKITSVAFCCISTGEFHFPNDEAAKIATDTVTQFLKQNPQCGLTRIIFNVFKDSDREIYEKIFLS